MSNFVFENQGTSTYLVYQVGENEQIDSMSLGMITNNKILGLVPTVFFQQDSTKYFKYNVSSKVSAEQFLMGSVNKKRIIGVFLGIVNAMISAEEYMIDPNSICLDFEHIYVDVSTCETVLICLPILDLERPTVDLKTLFKNIVFSTQFDQTENCDYIAKLINYLNSASAFSLEEFKELLLGIERGPQAASVMASALQRGSQPQEILHSQEVPKSQEIPQSTHIPFQQPAQVLQQAPVTQSTPIISQSAPTPVNPVQGRQASQNGGFAIPNQPQTIKNTSNSAKAPTASATSSTEEKGMSWLYLMQHYNKENAAIYKAQQDAKKALKAGQKQKSNKVTVPNSGFAVPGQQTPVTKNSDFAIPEKPMPKPTPEPQSVPMPKPTPGPQSVPMPKPTPEPQPAPIPQSTPGQQPAPSTPSFNFGETTVLSYGNIGETMVLGVSSSVAEVKPYLIRVKNNEKIMLDKPVFRIGKEKSYVDYFIGDNTAISRSHANIITRAGEYFVVDTNSTNHTYLNGSMLSSNVEAKISHGAKIKLANEDFEFKLY